MRAKSLALPLLLASFSGCGFAREDVPSAPVTHVSTTLIDTSGEFVHRLQSTDQGMVGWLFETNSVLYMNRDGGELARASLPKGGPEVWLAANHHSGHVAVGRKDDGYLNIALSQADGTPRWEMRQRWPSENTFYTLAVQGDAILVVGHARVKMHMGCPSTPKGVFMAWLRDGHCERVTQILLPAPVDETDPYARESLWVHDVAVARDGTLGLTGSFERELALANQSVNAAGEEDVFVAVLAPDGGSRFLRAAGGSRVERGVAIAFDDSGRTLLVGGTQELSALEAPLDFGDGALDEGEGDTFLAAFDAGTGATKWVRRPGFGGGVEIGGTDAAGRVPFVLHDASPFSSAFEKLPADDISLGKHLGVGALDLETGRPSFARLMGPTLANASVVPTESGMWVSAAVEGRPDVGTGKLRGSSSIMVRYELSIER